MAQTTKWLQAILDYMKKVRSSYQRAWPVLLPKQLSILLLNRLLIINNPQRECARGLQ